MTKKLLYYLAFALLLQATFSKENIPEISPRIVGGDISGLLDSMKEKLKDNDFSFADLRKEDSKCYQDLERMFTYESKCLEILSNMPKDLFNQCLPSVIPGLLD